jgi:ferredoxin
MKHEGGIDMSASSGASLKIRKQAIRGGVRLGELFTRGVLKLPGLDHVHPWLKPEKSDLRWLPINEDIQMPQDAPLPLELLYRFIQETSHRVIVDYCGCRAGWKCKHYPVNLGCLMMGDSALEIGRFPFREVGVDEAMEHARKAVDAGLVPIVGKARADNFIFKVKDRSRMLTTCFCCECCCVTRYTRYVPLKTLEPLQPRLESITMTVTDECKGCGKCVKRCYIEAIEVYEGRAVIAESCRACGRCAVSCPSKAIEIRIDDPDFLEKAYASISSHVKFD